MYQERLVDWEADYIHPGATVTQNQIARMQYFNRFQYPNQSSQPQTIGLKNLGPPSQQSFFLPPQGRGMLRQGVNQSNLAMCPIDEFPVDEEYSRTERRWANKRQIPIIQEPNRMFLTIPSQTERYPAYPIRNKVQPQNPVIPQYGYYNNDKTELIFPAKNQSQDSLCSTDTDRSCVKNDQINQRTISLDSEPSIPYIDQSDEGLELSSQSQESIFSDNQLDDTVSDCNRHHPSCKFSDSGNLHLNLSTDQYKTKTCSKSILRVDNSSVKKNSNLDNKLAKKSIRAINRTPVSSDGRSYSLPKNVESYLEEDLATDHFSVEKLCPPKQSNPVQELKAEIITAPVKVEHVPTVDDNRVEFENVHTNEAQNDSSGSECTYNGESTENKEGSVISTPKMHTIMPELNLDLSGLNSDVSSEDSNTSKCWKSPEEVRLGCGRVAALAKHFSKLGDAGIIKFKSKKLLSSRQFVSEPDIASPRSPEIMVRNNADVKQFKSEADLLMHGKFVPTTCEKEWSMILLDIQAREESEDRCGGVDATDQFENPNVNCSSEKNLAELSDESLMKDDKPDAEDDSPGELKKSESKLSLAEQQEIIEQLKEFSNLDNIDAPLFIPESIKIHEIEIELESRTEDSERVVTPESNTNSTYNSNDDIVNCSSLRMNNSSCADQYCKKNPLPAVLRTLNISPGFELSKKINKLDKYWSLKDLVSPSNFESCTTERVDGSPKYFVFPSCSRVVSAPEILDENLTFFHIRPLLAKFGNENIGSGSTVSIEKENVSEIRSIELESRSPKSKSLNDLYGRTTAACSVDLNIGDKNAGFRGSRRVAKFPESFIRTRKKSKSYDELSGNSDSSTVSGSFLRKPLVSKSCGNVSAGLSKLVSKEDDRRRNFRSVSEMRKIPTKVTLKTTLTGSCDLPLPVNSNVLIKRNCAKLQKPIRKKTMIVWKKSKSDLDISEQKPTPRFERGDWIFRDFPPLESELEMRKPADHTFDVF